MVAFVATLRLCFGDATASYVRASRRRESAVCEKLPEQRALRVLLAPHLLRARCAVQVRVQRALATHMQVLLPVPLS
jgi:hypothetical protein